MESRVEFLFYSKNLVRHIFILMMRTYRIDNLARSNISFNAGLYIAI